MKIIRVTALIAGATIALAGCSASAGAAGGDDPGMGTAEKPVTISFWHPAENMPKIVEAFEASHPGIKVDVTTVPSSQPDIAAKLIAAVKAGNAPDILKAEYQMLPYLVSQGALEKVSTMNLDDGMYRTQVRSLVSFAGDDYGAPEDFTPMMLFYRADIFEDQGFEVPETWEEYGALAKKVREVMPQSYLGNYNFDSNDIAGWSAQGGADWWKADNDGNWTVAIDSAPTVKAAEYRLGLVKDGLLMNELGTGTNNLLAEGTILSWTAGAWAPGTIMNANPELDGKWRAAPMPVWEKGDTHTAVSGGSAIVLGKGTQKKQAAEAFIKWYTDSEEGILERWKFSNLLSGSTRVDENPEILAMVPHPIDPKQEYLHMVASQDPKVFSNWGPNALLMQSTWKDLAPRAVKGEITPAEAVAELQKAVVSDMERSGFTVKTAD